MTRQCRGSEDTCVLLCVTVAAAAAANDDDDDDDDDDEDKPLGYSSSLTIPEIVIDCYDTPDTNLLDPFKFDLWLVHDQTDPDSFISSEEALDESDEEDNRSEFFHEVDLNKQLLTDSNSSTELDADTLPYVTYFLAQPKVESKTQVNTTVWCSDENESTSSHVAVKADQKANISENRGLCRLPDVASRLHQCSRSCLYVYSGPHIKREPCSLEQSPLGESCSFPC